MRAPPSQVVGGVTVYVPPTICELAGADGAWSGTSGRSVMIGSGMWMRAPNFLWMRSALRPSSPTPEASPAACGFDMPRSAA